MYNQELLYRIAANKTGLEHAAVKKAVNHYYKVIKHSLRNLESPAVYIDFIGTVYVKKSSIEKEMKKLIAVYRRAKKYFYMNPMRNRKIINHIHEEISKLNRLRKILKIFYAEKATNRKNRTGKTILATQMGYYRCGVSSRMAENNQESNYT